MCQLTNEEWGLVLVPDKNINYQVSDKEDDKTLLRLIPIGIINYPGDELEKNY